jgi:transcriptional regulator with XRE-family HTH domain
LGFQLPVGRGRRKREDSRYADRAAVLSGRLRALRERADLSQERLAARAEVAASTVRKIETGAVVEPGYFTVMALLAVLGASPEDLLT